MATNRSTTSTLVHEIISTWRQGVRPPNARQVLAEHPAVAGDKDLCLDLAYEEYCLRHEAGEQVAASTFCEGFPEYRHSLRRLIEVDAAFSQVPELERLTRKIPWPEPGDTFNEFEIVSVLGRGAFAKVYLATQAKLGGRLVVVKCTPCGATEAEILGKLKHDHIVPVHSVHYDEATALTAVCMPFLGGTTLIDVLDEGFKDGTPPTDDTHLRTLLRMSPARPRRYVEAILEMGADLADAIDYAHRHGVLHRDLKPSNVLIADGPSAMLLDFNLSRDADADGTHLGGTLPYMPPEQVRAVFLPDAGTGEDDVDERSDVFSLGVLLYQLLTGRLPYGEPDPELTAPEKARAHLAAVAQTPTPAHRINRDVDRHAGELIERCLHPDPAMRPQTGAELAQALSRRRRRRLVARRTLMGAAALGGIAVLSAPIAALIADLRDPDTRADRLLGQAALEDRQRHYSRAIQLYTEVIRLAPQRLEPFLRRAQCRLLDKPQDDESIRLAIEDLRSATDRGPDDGEANAWLLYAYALDPRQKAGQPVYDRAVAAGWKTASLCNNLGVTKKHVLPVGADAAFGEAVSLGAGRERGIAALNQALVQSAMIVRGSVEPGTRANPVPLYEEAIRLLPEEARIAFMAAQFCFGLDDKERGIEFLRQAIEAGYGPSFGELKGLNVYLTQDDWARLPAIKGTHQQRAINVSLEPPRYRPHGDPPSALAGN